MNRDDFFELLAVGAIFLFVAIASARALGAW